MVDSSGAMSRSDGFKACRLAPRAALLDFFLIGAVLGPPLSGTVPARCGDDPRATVEFLSGCREPDALEKKRVIFLLCFGKSILRQAGCRSRPSRARCPAVLLKQVTGPKTRHYLVIGTKRKPLHSIPPPDKCRVSIPGRRQLTARPWTQVRRGARLASSHQALSGRRPHFVTRSRPSAVSRSSSRMGIGGGWNSRKSVRRNVLFFFFLIASFANPFDVLVVGVKSLDSDSDRGPTPSEIQLVLSPIPRPVAPRGLRGSYGDRKTAALFTPNRKRRAQALHQKPEDQRPTPSTAPTPQSPKIVAHDDGCGRISGEGDQAPNRPMPGNVVAWVIDARIAVSTAGFFYYFFKEGFAKLATTQMSEAGEDSHRGSRTGPVLPPKTETPGQIL